MTYTILRTSNSCSFAYPEPTDTEVCHSKKELQWILERWQEEHSLVGSEESDASLLIWRGKLEDITDMEPDFQATLGPRGGLQLSPL